MKKYIALSIASFIAGIICSTEILRIIGVKILWYAPWLREEGYTVYKSEYMKLANQLIDMRDKSVNAVSQAYEDGYDQGCMDMVDEDLGSDCPWK